MTVTLSSDVSESSIVVASKDQISSDLAGEAVILNLKSGVYFGLNEVGAKIWTLIQQPRAVRDLRDALLAEYEVEPDVCNRDLLQLLQDLKVADLIEVSHEKTP
jgi:hypothetical protein